MWQHNPDISIAIVDDHPVVIEGLKNLLEAEYGFCVKARFTTGGDLLSYLKDNTVDIVLMDITLPDGSGIHFCKEICRQYPEMKILAISNLSERSIIRQMLQSGAHGYLLKTATAKDILECIQYALEGGTALSSEVKAIMAGPELGTTTDTPNLTKREKQILQLLAEGKKSAQIAAELFISPLTVKTHRATLLQKFQTNNIVTLIKLAKEYQLL